VYSAVFDGFQKFYIRSIIQIFGWAVFLILSIVLIPAYNLKGVGLAFFFQNLFVLFLAILIAIRSKFVEFDFTISFNKKWFKEITSFGFKFQATSILSLITEPIIKYFITKKLGLSVTANYEFANKLITQIRAFLVNANQVIVPNIVLHESKGTLADYFFQIQKRNTDLAVYIGLLTLFLSPIAILVFNNSFDAKLMRLVIVLNAGWVCNMITSIHYYTCIGLNKVGKLFFVHAFYAISILLLFIIFNQVTYKNIFFIFIPAMSLFIASVYNSWVLKNLRGSYYWITSTKFIMFLILSIILGVILP
jgi:O-antigen/teichoic acid export membrane protein